MTTRVDSCPVVENIDDVILQIFEESENDNAFFFPVTTQKEARAFVKALHAKGVTYTTICDEIVEFEQNFTSWRTGIGRPGIGNRVIERINRPIMEIFLFDLTDDDVRHLAAELQTSPPVAAVERIEATACQMASQGALLVADEESAVDKVDDVNSRLSVSPDQNHPEDAVDGCSVDVLGTANYSAELVTAGSDEGQVASKMKAEVDLERRSDDSNGASPVLVNDLQTTHVADELVCTSTTEHGPMSGTVNHAPVDDKKAPPTTSNESSATVIGIATNDNLVERLTEKDCGESEPLAVDSGAAQRSHVNGDSPRLHDAKQSMENHFDELTANDAATDLTSSATHLSTEATPPSSDCHQLEVTLNGTPTRPVDGESPKPETDQREKIANGCGRTSNVIDSTTPNKSKNIDENYNSDNEEFDECSSSSRSSQSQTLQESVQGDGPGYVYAFTDTSINSQSAPSGDYRIKIGASRHPYSRLHQAALFNVDIRLVSAVNVSARLAASRTVKDRLSSMALPDTAGWFVGPLDAILDALMTVSRQFPINVDSDC